MVMLAGQVMWQARGGEAAADRIRLITLDPGHFHAALFQKKMLPGISERVSVFAPLGPDLLAHLDRIMRFNTRNVNPTHWQLEVHAGPDFWERMLENPRGNVVVLSGNNRGKIDRIQAMVQLGLHVLADKPWIIEPGDLPKLEEVLTAAKQKGVVAYDAMTQRFEVSCLLARELVHDAAVFGTPLEGTSNEPAVEMASVHYLLKQVAGVPALRPDWFFDIRQQGEGLTDVGTHLVDLVQWTLFPDQAIDYHREVQVLEGARWPTLITMAQFKRVTGSADFPGFLAQTIRNSCLEYYANNRVHYRLRGVHVRLEVKWEFEPAAGETDTEFALFRGTLSRLEVRQGKEEKFRPEIYIIPNHTADRAEVLSALQRKVANLRTAYPGLACEDQANRIRVVIPDRFRVGHEAHFALLTRRFLTYIDHPDLLPSWEAPNMLAKYYVTTKGIELARKQ
ncbi:MAG: oxidoreductase [Candidatus Omnitrophica bacterium]|nr:oxidoreductase [Candidatus Omnitrophota bacterium]